MDPPPFLFRSELEPELGSLDRDQAFLRTRLDRLGKGHGQHAILVDSLHAFLRNRMRKAQPTLEAPIQRLTASGPLGLALLASLLLALQRQNLVLGDDLDIRTLDPG